MRYRLRLAVIYASACTMAALRFFHSDYAIMPAAAHAAIARITCGTRPAVECARLVGNVTECCSTGHSTATVTNTVQPERFAVRGIRGR